MAADLLYIITEKEDKAAGLECISKKWILV